MKKLALMALAALLTSSFLSCTREPVKKRPNVLIILTDDQEVKEIAKFGGKVLTPNMNSIGDSGIVLNKFYVNSPICSASRYSVLTGRYASRNKNIERTYPISEPAFIRWNTDMIPGKEQTIAHIMRANGYATGMVGKWHLGQPLSEETYYKTHDLDPTDPKVDQQIKTFYKGMQDYVKQVSGFEYVESLYGNNLHALGLPASIQQHNMEWITKGAIDFLDQHNPDKTGKPFFFYFAPTPPHVPDAVVSMRSDPRITPQGLLKEAVTGVQPSRDDVFRRVKQAGFDERTAPLTWLDDGIGAVLNKLKQLNALDNTIVIFMSDNGSHKGKMTCYDIAAHMPAMMMWKGKIRPGSVSDELTSNVDVLPTILDACHIAMPGDYHTDGLSLMPLITANKPLNRDFLYLEVVYQRAIVTKQWEYMATRFPKETDAKITPATRGQYSIEGEKQPDRYGAEKLFPAYFDKDQLYYLPTDPDEQKNLAAQPAYNKKLNDMKQKLSSVVSKLHNAFGEFGRDKK